MTVADHNRVLRAADQRAGLLEEKLAGLVRPVLERAGRDAAHRFRATAVDHLSAGAVLRRADRAAARRHGRPAELAASLAIRASLDVQAASTMVCVKPRPDEAAAIADPDGGPAENLHVTLAYLGELEGDLRPVLDALRAVAGSHAPLSGVVGGYGQFGMPDGSKVGILLPDVPGLVELRVAATEALHAAGLDYGRDHGFEAHLTVDGDPEPGELEKMLPLSGSPLHFDEILVVRGDAEVHPLPLVGPAPVTASGEPPPWTPPAGPEVIDTGELALLLRAKVEPVRKAVVKNVAGTALAAAGITFDVTNPLIAGMLTSAGGQIQGIAETTQADVMRAIRDGYDLGLSIPQTAELIRETMFDSAADRATLIARTELAGAVNGASLASTQLVQSATGDAYWKQWMTAEGARYPRHELDSDLDGQTVALDEYFDVNGSQLQYPGDPNGPPEEVCNCFPADTLVEMPSLRAAMRRWYDGDLVRVRLASGDTLAATPNHPVLRSDGQWVPLRLLQEGDDLVSARLAWDDAGAPDPDRPPAEIGETYRLAEIAGYPERIALRPPDLHGDGAYGDIDVVALDGDLFLDVEAASEENVAEFGLALASAARARTSRGDGATAVFDGWGKRFAWSAAYGVGPESQDATLFIAHPLHPDPVCVGASANRQPHLGEAAHDRGTPDAELLAHREDAVAALVTLAKVVQVEVEPFHGYVYNLDTGKGWYTAATIACRNCRCAMAYTDEPPG